MLKFRVYITEYEAGWGSRPDGHHEFDTFEEAESFAKEFNSKERDYECFWVASEPTLVDEQGRVYKHVG